jgi:hypothetical protein
MSRKSTSRPFTSAIQNSGFFSTTPRFFGTLVAVGFDALGMAEAETSGCSFATFRFVISVRVPLRARRAQLYPMGSRYAEWDWKRLKRYSVAGVVPRSPGLNLSKTELFPTGIANPECKHKSLAVDVGTAR